jgi:hypothetical protein
MIIMGNSVKAVIAYGVVAVVLFLLSYFLIIQPALDSSNEAIDRGFSQAEQISESISEQVGAATEQAREASEAAQRAAERGQKQGAGAN